ncbi:MAG: hypothetical protein QOF78_3549 [Phycisphaerales bacterium]|jgi:hypothetical protein|nr:hypothetical protein [Phycisphaerales bacterium]
MVLEPPAPVQSPVLKFLADYNPFYLLSACCMLFGVFAMNDSLDWSPIPMRQLLTMIITLNIYEAMLIALAVFLLRRGIRRDATILLIIEAFFLADVGFLNMEVFARDVWIGLIVNTFVLTAAIVKVALVFRAAQIPLADGRFAFVAIQLGVLFAAPGIFAIVAQPRDQHLPMLAIYGGWWLCGLLPVAYAVLVGSGDVFRRRLNGRPLGVELIVSRAMLALPMLSLIAHLCLANWVYKVTFHPLNVAPLLIGLAVAIGHCDQHVATLASRMRIQLALPFVAIALSAIKFPPELVFPFGGTEMSPLRLALLASALVYLDGLWLHRHAYFAAAAGLCLGFAGMGHSVTSINDNSLDLAKSSADAFDRMIPKTLFAWGFVSVIAAFVLLVLGAIVSMVRKDAWPIAVEETAGEGESLQE